MLPDFVVDIFVVFNKIDKMVGKMRHNALHGHQGRFVGMESVIDTNINTRPI